MSRRTLDDHVNERRAARGSSGLSPVMIVALVGVGLVVLGLVVAGFGVGARFFFAGRDGRQAVVSAVAGPSAEREGETWDHKELLAHLEAQGVKLESVPTNFMTVNGPAVIASSDPAALKQAAADNKEHYSFHGESIVYIQKLNSRQQAKDESAVQKHLAFSWGRFMFVSKDAVLLGKLRATLN